MRNRERYWFFLLPIGILMGFTLNKELGILQATFCALLLGIKLGRKLK